MRRTNVPADYYYLADVCAYTHICSLACARGQNKNHLSEMPKNVYFKYVRIEKGEILNLLYLPVCVVYADLYSRAFAFVTAHSAYMCGSIDFVFIGFGCSVDGSYITA